MVSGMKKKDKEERRLRENGEGSMEGDAAVAKEDRRKRRWRKTKTRESNLFSLRGRG